MYQIKCLNLLTDQVFEKEFEFYEDFRRFLNRCRFSKKVKVISWWKY